MTEAVELNEPGALAALVGLKLSKSLQFGDRPGTCELVRGAVYAQGREAEQWARECRL